MRPHALLPLLLLSAGCDPSGAPKNGPAGDPGASSDDARDLRSAEGQALATSLDRLSFDLYGKLKSEAGNLVFSPASVATALLMTLGGARGETRDQLLSVLRIDGEPGEALREAGAMLRSWNDPGRTAYTLAVANRLFGEQQYSFLPDFLTQTRQDFDAELRPLDFRGQPEAAREAINGWVAERTRDRILDLVPPGGVDAETRLALVNAVYLLADWESPFGAGATRPMPFTLAGGERVDVPTMHQVEQFRAGKSDGVLTLELPYVGGGLSLTLLLPEAPDGLDALESRLSPEQLARWMAATRTQRVVVALPRFRIDPPQPLRLGTLLKQLGLTLAFDPENADFTGIADPPDRADRLVISEVFHKAFIAVDERGTEAAAATAVVMARAGSAPPAEPPFEFKADHPFLFVLRDQRSGAILFLGRVTDPRGGG